MSTTMTGEQKARVIANCEVIAKALREGRGLEFCRVGDEQMLYRDSDPRTASPCAIHLEYRLKPEPRTIWVNEYKDGVDSCYVSEHAARISAIFKPTRIAVEYREVVK